MRTDTASTTVRRLTPADITTAAELFASAFSDDPLNVLLIPDANRRRRAHARLVRPRLVGALRYGHVFCATQAESMCGLAVWAPPHVRLSAQPPLNLLPSALRGVSHFTPGLPRVARSLLSEPQLILRQSAVRRRAVAGARNDGAWHLAGLAVAPEYQGQGIARALLDPMLARADLDGTGVWLETNYPTNAPLYQRFGFTVTSHLPGRGALPAWWLMQRPPERPANTAAPARGGSRAMSTSTLSLTIAPLDINDLDAAAALFANAFDNDRMARLLHPDNAERHRFHEQGGRVQIERSMAYRHVFAAYEDEAVRGLAVWLPPGVNVRPSPPPLRTLPRIARALANPGAIRLLRQRQRALATAHETPSWHLAFLATDPAHQGRGIGRRLLEHILQRADADGTPVWLETSDPANVGLYEKFGFATIALIEGAASLPTFWIMVHSAASRNVR